MRCSLPHASRRRTWAKSSSTWTTRNSQNYYEGFVSPVAGGSGRIRGQPPAALIPASELHMSAEQIKFGTDGWRGIIADDFTDENVRLVARAIASYVLKSEDSGKGLVVGYDTRFGSPRFAQIVSEESAAAGIQCAWQMTTRRRQPSPMG